MKKLHPRTVRAILAAYERGEPIAAICKRYGVGSGSVRRAARAAGLLPRVERLDEKTVAYIKRRYASGVRVEHIRQELGISACAVRKVVGIDSYGSSMQKRTDVITRDEKLAFVRRVYPGANLDGRSDDYVQGAYDQAMRVVEQERAALRGES